MHELAIMQNVVSVCEREAEKHGFKRVKTIALAVGAVSGIVPECMFEFFPAAAAGTVAEGAKLTTRVIPVPRLRRSRIQAHARQGVLHRFDRSRVNK